MTDDVEQTSFPQYQPPVNPRGIPVAHPQHGKFLQKFVRQLGKVAARKPKARGKKGLQSRDTVAIKHKAIKWY